MYRKLSSFKIVVFLENNVNNAIKHNQLTLVYSLSTSYFRLITLIWHERN